MTLVNTTVTAGTYGTATEVPSITVDSKGRITSCTNTTITNNNPWTSGTNLIYYNDGNVGIGTTTVSAKLHIGETTGTAHDPNSGTIILDHDNPGGQSSIVFRSKVNRGIDYAYINYKDNTTGATSGQNSQLLIGTSNDSDDNIIISASGGSGLITLQATTTAMSGDITAVGNITAYFSDNRLKTYISDIKDPLEIINSLKGFYYKPNETAKSYGYNNTKKELGLSAQDVKKVLPELITLAPFDRTTDKDGNIISKSGEDYLTMSYERLSPVFVEAIKAMKKELDDLKEMKKELDELREFKKELDELREFKKEFEDFKKMFIK